MNEMKCITLKDIYSRYLNGLKKRMILSTKKKMTSKNE